MICWKIRKRLQGFGGRKLGDMNSRILFVINRLSRHGLEQS